MHRSFLAVPVELGPTHLAFRPAACEGLCGAFLEPHETVEVRLTGSTRPLGLCETCWDRHARVTRARS